LRAINPLGTQFASAIRPPGRHVRTIVGCPLLIRREHRPERGEHHIEHFVLERQRLRIGHRRCQAEPLALGACLGDLQKGLDEVAGGHASAATRGGDRGVAAARRNVEHTLTCVHVDRAAQQLADEHQPGADSRKVTR
jgi:hypothetical protein